MQNVKDEAPRPQTKRKRSHYSTSDDGRPSLVKKLKAEKDPITLPKHRRSGVDLCSVEPIDNGTNPNDGLQDEIPFGIDFHQYFKSLSGNPRKTPTTVLFPPQKLATVSASCMQIPSSRSENKDILRRRSK